MTRLNRVLEVMAKEQVDCVIIKDETTIRYVTGFSGDSSLFYLDRYKGILITDGRYTQQAKQEMKLFKVLEYAPKNASSIWEAAAECAKKAGAQLLLEIEGKIQPLFHRQKAGLLDDDPVAGGHFIGYDGAGKGRSKSNQPLAASGGKFIHKDGFAGKEPAEGFFNAAAGIGLHLHIRAHPAHRAALGAERLALGRVADQNGQMPAFDFIFQHRKHLLGL